MTNLEAELKLGICRVFCNDCGIVLYTDEGNYHKSKPCPKLNKCKEEQKQKELDSEFGSFKTRNNL